MEILVSFWDSILNYAVLIFATISLLTTITWSFFNVERKKMLVFSFCIVFSSVILLFPHYYLWAVYSFFIFKVGLQWLCPLMLLITIIFVAGNVRGKQLIAIIAYVLNSAFLLLGMESLKSAGGTSGNFGVEAGIYVVFNGLIILQVLAYLYESNFFYGISKLSLGIISTILIIIWGLNRGDASSVGDRENFSRKSLIFVTLVLITEGLLLIYKARKDRYLKNHKMA